MLKEPAKKTSNKNVIQFCYFIHTKIFYKGKVTKNSKHFHKLDRAVLAFSKIKRRLCNAKFFIRNSFVLSHSYFTKKIDLITLCVVADVTLNFFHL